MEKMISHLLGLKYVSQSSKEEDAHLNDSMKRARLFYNLKQREGLSKRLFWTLLCGDTDWKRIIALMSDM